MSGVLLAGLSLHGFASLIERPSSTKNTTLGFYLPHSHSCSDHIILSVIMYRVPQVDGIEDVKRYRPGGFHPVNLQDTLGGKYKIIHKLGHGGFGTVWLGRVLEEHRNVAIKVLMANASSNDLDILTYLRDHGGNHSSIANLQDVFTVHGPNGHHQCLVLDIAGPSLKQLVADNVSLAGRSARLATQKIAEGVAHLHSVGICHGGKCFS